MSKGKGKSRSRSMSITSVMDRRYNVPPVPWRPDWSHDLGLSEEVVAAPSVAADLRRYADGVSQLAAVLSEGGDVSEHEAEYLRATVDGLAAGLPIVLQRAADVLR